MSWVARKLCGSDWEDADQVVTEYLNAKTEAKLLQEKQLKEFWAEYERDTYCAGGS
jgi:hypothetical protein